MLSRHNLAYLDSCKVVRLEQVISGKVKLWLITF